MPVHVCYPGQGLEHRSDRANEVAQNVYKNPNLQYLRDDPNSPYYQGGQDTDENGQPIGNCSEINAGCTAGDEELDEYTGDEVVIIGSTKESLFYYHPDHLGSASVITDGAGTLREHLEYFAFGETWVQEGASKKTPYLYTGKEFDQETGLYYYGARYYDPRTSVWQSVDPILEKYLPSGDPEKDKNLPGMGGVFNSLNMAPYTYSHHNPVRYVDPDGNAVDYNENVVFNPNIRVAIEKFDAKLSSFLETSNSHITTRITGGDRAINHDEKVISMSNRSHITKSKTSTAHAIKNGARAIDFNIEDLNGNPIDISPKIVKQLMEESGFSVIKGNFFSPENYPGGEHYHGTLLSSEPENHISGFAKTIADMAKKLILGDDSNVN